MPTAASFCILRIERCSERLVVLHLAFFGCSPAEQRALIHDLRRTVQEKAAASASQLADDAARAGIALPVCYSPIRLPERWLNPSLIVYVSDCLWFVLLVVDW